MNKDLLSNDPKLQAAAEEKRWRDIHAPGACYACRGTGTVPGRPSAEDAKHEYSPRQLCPTCGGTGFEGA